MIYLHVSARAGVPLQAGCPPHRAVGQHISLQLHMPCAISQASERTLGHPAHIPEQILSTQQLTHTTVWGFESSSNLLHASAVLNSKCKNASCIDHTTLKQVLESTASGELLGWLRDWLGFSIATCSFTHTWKPCQ